jgi:predicted nucleic acid-binding protein
VKRYVAEPGHEEVIELLREGLLATSRISEIEVASALARRCREGLFAASERDRALAALRQDVAAILLVEPTAEVVARSVALLVRHPLRAADALQLASCLELGRRLHLAPRFIACDERLRAAACGEGLDTAP